MSNRGGKINRFSHFPHYSHWIFIKSISFYLYLFLQWQNLNITSYTFNVKYYIHTNEAVF